MNEPKKNTFGFTLVEVLIAMIIASLAIAFAVPIFSYHSVSKTRIEQRITQIATVSSILPLVREELRAQAGGVVRGGGTQSGVDFSFTGKVIKSGVSPMPDFGLQDSATSSNRTFYLYIVTLKISLRHADQANLKPSEKTYTYNEVAWK